MDKLTARDRAEENFRKLAALFPGAVTETGSGGASAVRRVLDAEALAREIGAQVAEGPGERYQFTWPGKRQAMLAANTPAAGALRPCREESADFDRTENLYIEGDNLEVLKLLRETFMGKVKVIYIDPPYNTGGHLLYRDNFALSREDFARASGQRDEAGNLR